MTIKHGSVVSLTYVLSNDKNEELDRADDKEPFFYLHGYGQLVSALESALEGLKVGDHKKVSFQPKASKNPMSAEVLNFDVTVSSIREATAEELKHGHAHGADGHHHH